MNLSRKGLLERKLTFAFLLLVQVIVSTRFASAFPVAPENERRRVGGGVSLASSVPQQKQSYTININEKSPRDISKLEEWLMNCGIQKVPGLQLTTHDGGLDFQIMTTEDLPADTPILFVPNNGVILSSEQIHQEEVGDGRRVGLNAGGGGQQILNGRTLLNQLGQTDHFPRFCLFVKIIMEYEKGFNSPWFPWFDSLPRYYTNGASMTEFCSTCLPPLAAKLTKKERIRCKHFHQTLIQLYGHLISEEYMNNEELIRWAYNVVYTRCRVRKGEPVIIPVVDFFNHATNHPEAVVKYDDQGNCHVYTTADVPAGSPIRISYTNGDNTNPSHLLARYGFLDYEATATFCKYVIDKPSQEIIRLGYHPSKMLFHNTGEVSEAVWDILLYQVLERIDREQQNDFYESHKQGDTETKQAFHQHYFPQTSAALLDHVNGFLQQLETVSNIADGANINQHPRIPNILAHNAFVQNTFIAVKYSVIAKQMEAGLLL